MYSKVEKRGDRKLTYSNLIFFLEQYRISFLTLNFAQQLLCTDIQKGLDDPNYDRSEVIYGGDLIEYLEKGILDEKKIITNQLQKDIIHGHFKSLCSLTNNDNRQGINSLNMQNFHFLRGRFVNNIFEILNKYILNYESQFALSEGSRKNTLRTKLEKKDWYVMLYIIRNNASHADGLHTPFRTPPFLKNLNKTEFIWKNIRVVPGMISHQIRYNNDELLELYHEMLNYILNNESIFTTDHKGARLLNLL